MAATQDYDPIIEALAAEGDASLYPDVDEAFLHLRDELQDLEEYNFRHFRTKHLAFDLRATVRKEGIPPGEPAPDFELPRVYGGPLRLSALRGRPVLLHFGSYT
jgi:hypothetical protein